jgi:hypothetical protein
VLLTVEASSLCCAVEQDNGSFGFVFLTMAIGVLWRSGMDGQLGVVVVAIFGVKSAYKRRMSKNLYTHS